MGLQEETQDNGSDVGSGEWRDVLTGFQNICRVRSQDIHDEYISYQPPIFSPHFPPFLCFSGSHCKY